MSVPTQHVQPAAGMPAQPAPKNGLGTTSLVMGILSILGAWIPFAGFGSYITSIIGIVTGAAGRKRATSGRATNRGAATGGLVMSIVGLASVILATVVYSSLLYAATSGSPSDVPTSTATHAVKANGHAAGIGDKVQDGRFTFTVTKVRTGVTHLGTNGFGQKAQGQFVIINVTVSNHGNESQTFDASSQVVYDKAGRKYSADGEAAVYLDNSNAFLNDINPGNTVKGKLVFDMSKTANANTIELHDSPFSDGVTVSLR